ncbi:GTPase Era [Beduini massiliensis]|uniref:GTPase Era n=1 Tax=Beduini massiliensis TaxID=1585974 RepID=UPI00059A97D1|nr:GTPase Era [Beduini massiliensis]
MFKSGFVSIVGRPNAGKSTLLNQMLKTKLAIMSDVAQTTRNTIQGIYTDEDSQIVFIDTPGVHKPQDRLGSFMNTSALNSIYGADVILFIAPANEKIGKGDHYIINRLKEAEIPVYLVLNKVDLLSKEELIQKLMEWQDLFPFKEIIPISAKTGLQVDHLIRVLKDDLHEGPKYYEDDQLTDHPERFIIAEFIREKILHYTHEEVPHSVAILIDKIEEDEKEHRLDVIASIVVTRDSQKGIIIGKQGAMIKKIRLAARKDIRQFLGMDVDLDLFVKVEKDWRNKEKYLKELGYNEDEY